MSWRSKAAEVIAETLADCRAKGLDEKATAKALSDAYPFGERAMHPYKVWLDELAIQTGKKREKDLAKARKIVAEHNARLIAEGQPTFPGMEQVV